ncbi:MULTISPECIES: glycosyltransferase [unclassified Solwaraspora]|uniref:glycosyltransferase n=1 Tax=unclassified Solwaraspora TaxID=2627926 RepID=UPI00248B1143|nr:MULTISPECIES: glycosyltransferase [unclassified Solwaraspora]WBB99653.1 glycosyltransferase [Solwaraspora sp. WMMA2059]WBC21797.1 glycosyltransferase [Solwaraspora sp. WMMA2080]WJK36156.1 glycosyltransferase [Solwaraspora sp. WMMA2065]
MGSTVENSLGSAMGTVAVSTQTRFQRTPDGAVWTVNGPAHAFWTRYLSAFDRVRLLAEVTEEPQPPSGASRVDGAGVEVWPLPYRRGPLGLPPGRAGLRRSLRYGVDDVDAVILRSPSPAAGLLVPILRRWHRGYAVEVVADPQDMFDGPVTIDPVRRWRVHRAARQLREQCRDATAVAYTTGTGTSLRLRCPPGPNTVATDYPDVDLRADAFVCEPREPSAPGGPVTLISAGTLDHSRHGVDVVLAAMRRLADDGVLADLVYLGDGRSRPRLEHRAARLGLTDRLVIAGDRPATEIRSWLDAADVFVSPGSAGVHSPVVVEAMARGLPVVAVGAVGPPDLIEADCLVTTGGPAALAEAVRRLLTRPQRMVEVAAAGLVRSRAYRTELVAPRRAMFYRAVRMAGRPTPVAPAARGREHAPTS